MINLRGLFVTGTDTGVGKTLIAAAVTRSLIKSGRRVGVLKPVATGAGRSGMGWRVSDAEVLIEAVGAEIALEHVTPLIFEEALAPVVAARRLGKSLDHEEIVAAVNEALHWWAERAEVIVIEGVGGLLCPLAEGTTIADLAVALDYPLVIVGRRGLGAMNHVLLTVEAARTRGLRIAGVILNGVEESDPVVEATNAVELAIRVDGCAILAEVPHGADRSALSASVDKIDWYSRAGLPRRWVAAAGIAART